MLIFDVTAFGLVSSVGESLCARRARCGTIREINFSVRRELSAEF
jgi:hypothetical protein